MMGAAPWESAHERAAPMLPGPSGPLAGIRIIDLTQALAGPFCTMLLADLGADVIKVEPPAGDMSRYSFPFTSDDTERAFGAYFASINRNKRGIVLDLKLEHGRERFLRLVDSADAVMENFRAGVMDRLGIGWEVLHARNPRLVYGAIRGFGDPRTGESPYVDWPSYDVVGQAMSGIVSVTGAAEGEVFRVGPSVGDIYPATVAALGLTAGLLHARTTGRGQFMDVGMYDALVAMCEAIIYRYSYAGIVSKPAGNSHPQLSPFDIYPTADGACAIAAPTSRHWDLLCEIMHRSDLIHDPRTETNNDRIRNAAFVRDVITAWTSARTTAEIVRDLAGVVPVGPVNNAADIFADPHIAARQMLVAVDHPGSGRPGVLPNSPIRYTGTPVGIYRRAPKLGEHNAEVFAELERKRQP